MDRRFPPRAMPRAIVLLLAGVASAAALAQSTLFRLSDIDLRDPHIFVAALGCHDVTDSAFGGFAFNAQVQAEIQSDGDGDGLLDASVVLEFMPLDQARATNFVAAGDADCRPPAASPSCGPIAMPFAAGDATLAASGQCSGTLAGTLRPYNPAVTAASAPCFATPPATAAIVLAGIPLSLQDTAFAATFVGTPATQLTNGLLRGFLSQATADATLLPASYPLVGGQPLSRLLPGGANNCAAHSDLDSNNGVPGWWFYFNYVAVPATALPAAVFGNGFEGGP
jgi:hypothetical protein